MEAGTSFLPLLLLKLSSQMSLTILNLTAGMVSGRLGRSGIRKICLLILIAIHLDTWSSDGEIGFGRLPPSLHNEVVERPIASRLR